MESIMKEIIKIPRETAVEFTTLRTAISMKENSWMISVSEKARWHLKT